MKHGCLGVVRSISAMQLGAQPHLKGRPTGVLTSRLAVLEDGQLRRPDRRAETGPRRFLIMHFVDPAEQASSAPGLLFGEPTPVEASGRLMTT